MNIKAIKIDPIKQQITEYLWKNTENFEELYKEIGSGCRTIQVVRFDRENVLLCDEDGRIKQIKGAFIIDTHNIKNLIIAGIAFVVGVGNGDDFGDATVGVETVGHEIAWYPKRACAGLQLY